MFVISYNFLDKTDNVIILVMGYTMTIVQETIIHHAFYVVLCWISVRRSNTNKIPPEGMG